MPRVILVSKCHQCPWNTWDYRRAEFRCTEPRFNVYLPGQAAASHPPEECPLASTVTLQLEPKPAKASA